jgi:hypothetical protein
MRIDASLVHRAGKIRLKAAVVIRRANPLYVVYAITLILGLAGGLLVGSRDSSVSPPTTYATGQTDLVAIAKTSSDVAVDEAFTGDVTVTPGGFENPSHAAIPVIGDEHTARHVPPVDKARGSKDLGANPSETMAKTPGGKASIGSYVSTERETEQRQGVGPCRLLVSERSLSIHAGGGSDTITVSSQNAEGTARVTATTKNWPDIVVFPELRGNSGGTVKDSVISVSKRAGTYAVNFKSPCGMKTIPVTVQQP